MAPLAPILPDLLSPGLRVVFCGTAPGTASARAGAYYAGPGNRFWTTLREVGLTPIRLEPAEFARLPEFGIGLTDVSKTASGSDREVGRRGVEPERLAAVISTAAPAHLAFNGKNAARAALGRPVSYGRQPERLGGASVWVLLQPPGPRAASGTSSRGSNSRPPPSRLVQGPRLAADDGPVRHRRAGRVARPAPGRTGC
jgi:TDG/mug DNA glycosylase family protein